VRFIGCVLAIGCVGQLGGSDPTDAEVAAIDDAGSPSFDAGAIAIDDAGSVTIDDAGMTPAFDAGMTQSFDAGAPPEIDAGPPGDVACDSGGQIAGSRGAEAPFGEAVVGLCRMALGCPSSWEMREPVRGSYGDVRGTPNHRLLWRVWYYGWARRAGTAAQIEDARAALLDFFARMQANGHYAWGPGGSEVLTTSHYQIWANGMSCARLLAVVHEDAPLLDVTGRFWRSEIALWNVLARGGSIDAPGARFHAGGPSQLRDVLYAMIQGRTLPRPANNASAPWWSDYYNVAAWTLREVLRMGDDLGGARRASAADLPLLPDPLHVRTRGDDHVFVFPRLRALDPLYWVAFIGGEKSYAPHVDGMGGDNPHPPPALPGATELVLPGVAR
jgi:hypothetical protein